MQDKRNLEERAKEFIEHEVNLRKAVKGLAESAKMRRAAILAGITKKRKRAK